MPATGLRGRDDRVDSVLVRRIGVDGEEMVDEIQTREPIGTVDQILHSSNSRRQFDLSDLGLDLGADDVDLDDDDIDETPIPVFVTSIVPAQPTGVQSNNGGPSATIGAQTTSGSSPNQLAPSNAKGGISRTTEHLLIAAGSIGATIVLVMVILAIHTMRKRGLTFKEAVQQGKYQVTRRGPPPPPPKATGWDSKPRPSFDHGSIRKDTVTPPQPAMSIARSGSSGSQRPLMTLQRNESFNNRPMATQRVSPSEPPPKSFFLDSPPARNNSHRRNDSQTPSSPVLPLQNGRRSVSTYNTRSLMDQSDPKFSEPPVERELSPLPPPPSFKQFLFNRPSVSGRPGVGAMVSRFSWTNSQAPQTPHDLSRDTNSHVLGRESFMTSRSSVPRFRTVDSWVSQQANRLEAEKLKSQFRLTATTEGSTDDEREAIPEVPQIPKKCTEGSKPTESTVQPTNKKPTSPIPLGLPGKNVKHERHDTRTTVETAPIFRQHPGTEVRFSTRSAVPSEILDMGSKNNVLS